MKNQSIICAFSAWFILFFTQVNTYIGEGPLGLFVVSFFWGTLVGLHSEFFIFLYLFTTIMALPLAHFFKRIGYKIYWLIVILFFISSLFLPYMVMASGSRNFWAKILMFFPPILCILSGVFFTIYCKKKIK